MVEDGEFPTNGSRRHSPKAVVSELSHHDAAHLEHGGFSDGMSQKHPDLESFAVSTPLLDGDLTLISLEKVADRYSIETASEERQFGPINGALLCSRPGQSVGFRIEGFREGGIAGPADLNLPARTTFANGRHSQPPRVTRV